MTLSRSPQETHRTAAFRRPLQELMICVTLKRQQRQSALHFTLHVDLFHFLNIQLNKDWD